MRLRVLHITPTLDLAGAQRQLAMLLRGLPRGEFEPRVLALRPRGPMAAEFAAAGVPVELGSRYWPWDVAAGRRLWRSVAEWSPAVIHSWRRESHPCAAALARLSGAAWVAHVYRPEAAWSIPGRWFERRLMQRCRHVLANGEALRAWLIAQGWPAERITAVDNAVEPAAPPVISRSELLRELGLPHDARLVIVLGELREAKRLKDAIWTADLLKVIRKDVYFLIIGDGPHRRRLTRFRDQVRIADHVHLLGLRMDARRLLAHGDVFLSTSASEGQARSILEAMAAGVPVVGSDIPGTRELIVDGVTGLLAPVGDRALFTRQVNRLLDDRRLAEQLADNARRRVAERFSPLRLVEAVSAVYRDGVRNYPPP